MKLRRNAILLGGPGSGKSNYLFRTWLAIEKRTGVLVNDGLPSDLEYLNDGASRLLDGHFAPHTPLGTYYVCDIPVAQRDDRGIKGNLLIPDASGEIWLEVYDKRIWPARWNDLLTHDCGFLLLVRAGSPHNVPALDWLTCERLYGGGISPQATGTPTQVRLVDWLQSLRAVLDSSVGESFLPRLGVVVTAWDRVPSDRQYAVPEDYLETEFPLFAQFLRAEAHRYDVKVFGLSIVGGDLDMDADFREAYMHPGAHAATSGYVVTAGSAGRQQQRETDVLWPIYWALAIEP